MLAVTPTRELAEQLVTEVHTHAHNTHHTNATQPWFIADHLFRVTLFFPTKQARALAQHLSPPLNILEIYGGAENQFQVPYLPRVQR
jgi:hypothetical protein